MDQKEINKILDYLPVIVGTCDRYGWLGGNGVPVEPSAVTGARRLFKCLTSELAMEDIPSPEDVEAGIEGGINIIWETELDPNTCEYDYFYIDIRTDELVFWKSKFDSLGTEESGMIDLNKPLGMHVLKYLRYFNEQK